MADFNKNGKRIKVTGLNQTNLLKKLWVNGITVYDYVKKSPKVCFFTVKREDFSKFFAITDKTCYNIKTIKEYGVKSFFKKIKNAAAFLIAFFVFTVASYAASAVFTGIDFYGSGAEYSERLTTYFNKQGFKSYRLFPEAKLKELETKTLKENDYLSFVSLKKRGSRLKATVIKKVKDLSVKNPIKTDLVSDVSGIVSSVRVYRGFSAVRVGDEVQKGDILVKTKGLIKDNEVETDIIAMVTIMVTVTDKITLLTNDPVAAAVLYKTEKEVAGEYSDEIFVKEDEIFRNDDGGYIFKVTAIKTVAVSTYKTAATGI